MTRHRIERAGEDLLLPCTRCGGILRGQVTEGVYWGLHAWAVSWRCATCDNALEEDDSGEVYGIYREALVARVGLARLRADASVNAPARVRLLAALRRDGVTIAEAVASYERLTGEGIIGTPVEMRMLADRLIAAGATVTVEPVAAGT